MTRFADGLDRSLEGERLRGWEARTEVALNCHEEDSGKIWGKLKWSLVCYT